jgi:hypothetical protein
LTTSARIGEWAATPIANEGAFASYQSELAIHGILVEWCTLLIPLGAGTLLAAIAGLAWKTQGRFGLRSLFLGIAFLCFVIGIPFGLVCPWLQEPRIGFESGIMTFEQKVDGKNFGHYYGLPLARAATIGALPLIVLPFLFFVPKRT